MLIRVMLCFLGKVEGISRGIAVHSSEGMAAIVKCLLRMLPKFKCAIRSPFIPSVTSSDKGTFWDV